MQAIRFLTLLKKQAMTLKTPLTRKIMKNRNSLIVAILATSTLAFTACDVDQTQSAKAPEVDVDGDSGNLPEYKVVQTEEGELPSVDVDVEGGQLPEYDVDTADVNIGTTTETMKVPKVKLVVEEEEFEVPFIDVSMPGDKEGTSKKKRTSILASVKTPNPGYQLSIRRVYLLDNVLAVISEVTRGDVQKADGQGVASDGLVLNAPDTEINHYVITSLDDIEGRRGDYTFVESIQRIEEDFSDGRVVYDRDDQQG